MSLRIFHLIFICISTLFMLGFAVWLADLAQTVNNGLWYIAVAACVITAAAMLMYAVRFFRKTRNMIPAGSL